MNHSLIANRYQIIEEIGRGGIGIVYTAQDTQLGQIVAVKQLRREQVDVTPSLFERFIREGEILRELDHPNIVKILDMVDEENNHYIIEEYFPDGDLSAAIREGAMDIERVLQIALELADALTRAHHLNVVHRDLKPANVLLAEDGTPRLTDFGVALIGSKKRMTERGTPVGTIEYLSPEALTADVDNRADIWAFGVMLFEMLTGHRPFRGNSLAAIVSSILTEPTPDIEHLRPEIPMALADLIYRMLEKERSARISSVRLVGAELEAILQGQRVDNYAIPVASGHLGESRFAQEAYVPDSGTRHNLPARSSNFIGRESELERLMQALQDGQSRLITLQGAGGIGKTRLAIELGDKALESFRNRVFFVELAPLREENLILPIIAEALRYKFQQDGRSQLRQIQDYLHSKKSLLILDNFEHMLGNTKLISQLIAAAPELHILVTSRQRLNLSGELVVVLEGMEFPRDLAFQDALNTSAVRLFMQSARRVTPDFTLAQADMPYVARICQLVEGLPLGIVLAASWVGMLDVAEIANEIAEDADFLSTDMGDVVERHRSMRAVFDYSWWLLDEEEQNSFMKLAIFRGGFTREAAIEIAGANLRMMMSLMNKSLLRRNPDDGRYSIHDMLRQYAKEKLSASPHFETVRRAHKDYFIQLAHEQGKEFYGGAQLRALELMNADIANIRAAWRTAIHSKDYAALSKLTKLWTYFDVIGIWQDTIDACEFTLKSLPDLNSQLAGEIYTMAAICAYRMGDLILAEKYTNDSLRIFTALDLPDKLLLPRINQANIWSNTGESSRAYTQYKDVAESAGKMGFHWEEATAYLNLGYYSMLQQDLDEAEIYLRRSLELGRERSDLLLTGVALHNLGDVAYRRGELPQAQDLFNESLSIGLMFDSVVMIYVNLIFLAKASLDAGDYATANDYVERAAAVAEDTSYRSIDHIGLRALIAFREGRFVDCKDNLLALLRDNRAVTTIELSPESFEALPHYLAHIGRQDEARFWLAWLLGTNIISEVPVITRLKKLEEEIGAGDIDSDILTKIEATLGILGKK